MIDSPIQRARSTRPTAGRSSPGSRRRQPSASPSMRADGTRPPPASPDPADAERRHLLAPCAAQQRREGAARRRAPACATRGTRRPAASRHGSVVCRASLSTIGLRPESAHQRSCPMPLDIAYVAVGGAGIEPRHASRRSRHAHQSARAASRWRRKRKQPASRARSAGRSHTGCPRSSEPPKVGCLNAPRPRRRAIAPRSTKIVTSDVPPSTPSGSPGAAVGRGAGSPRAGKERQLARSDLPPDRSGVRIRNLPVSRRELAVGVVEDRCHDPAGGADVGPGACRGYA